MKDLDKYCISSLEEWKIIFDRYNNIVIKKTNKSEYLNNIAITEILKKTRIKVVKVLDYRDGEMIMECVEWKNIEELLETKPENRHQYVTLLKNIYKEIEKSWIIIQDFAPRNIIYSESTWQSTLIDFERGFIDISQYNNDEIRFIQSFVLEEFYAFLSHDEVKKIFWENQDINFQSINYEILNNIQVWSRRNEIIKQIKHAIISQWTNFSHEKELTWYFLINKFMSYFINQDTTPKMIHQIDWLALHDYVDRLLYFIYLKIK